MERMERAYDDWKAGTWSKDPYVDMVIPTRVNDPTMAPPGKHFMSCFIQYCPHQLEGREWTDPEREAFAQTVIDQISNYSPDFKDLIVHYEVRTPADIEDQIGITEGNIFPRRTDHGPAVVQPPRTRLCKIQGTGRGTLHVRLEHAPGRWRHGRARRECSAGDSLRPQTQQHGTGELRR